MTIFTATYSPDDNKLRLTASARLDAETYARVKAAGFSWAPKQEQFIAPMWTPGRADLCIELAGEIDDEDGTLMDRAEVRAERFSEYEDKRGAEADRALDHVHTITSGIPLGQPIMIGHHSEARARRDAKRIETGMRRAVDLFDTSQYWKRRAAAAISHAKYKERADVRHRRIKGLESDQRKQLKTIDEHEKAARLWSRIPRVEWDKQSALATYVAGRISVGSWGIYSDLSAGKMHGDTAWRMATAQCEAMIEHAQRWLDHIENRIEYERAMLGESGGIAAERFNIEAGGRVLIGAEWCIVLRVNKSGGKVVSVTTNARYVSVRGIEEVQDYRAPDAEEAAKVDEAKKLAPLCNYRTADCKEMTADEWKSATRHSDSYFVDKVAATEEAVAHRRRTACSSAANWKRIPVFLTDAKAAPPAKPGAPRKGAVRGPWTKDPADVPKPEPIRFERQIEPSKLAPLPTQSVPPATHSQFEAVRQSLKAGVATVSATQLFPTPPTLAARMVEAAGVQKLDRVLEPSAGTGRILQALGDALPADCVTVQAVEIRRDLCDQLRRSFPLSTTHCADFLAIDGPGSYVSRGADDPRPFGTFDCILMNPPFAQGADVDHMTHATRFLAPGGRLVAIMSAGVTFRSDKKTSAFREMVERMGGSIEELPANTFESSGTGVNTVLVSIVAPASESSPKPPRQAQEPEPAAHMPVSSDQVAAIAHNSLRKCEAWADGTITGDEIMRAADALESCWHSMKSDSAAPAYRSAVSRLRAVAAVRGEERAAMVAIIEAGAERYFAQFEADTPATHS